MLQQLRSHAHGPRGDGRFDQEHGKAGTDR
jgi:hypothetical protein